MSEIPLPNEKRFRLSRLNVLVTGGTRDIGAGIVSDLARYGAHTYAVHRDPGKSRRAAALQELNESVDGEIIVRQTDLTKRRPRQNALNDFLFLNSRLDVLILNAAGRDRAINVDANNAMVDLSLPYLEESKGTIVFMQSLAGHFYPHLVKKGYIDPEYLPVARTKFEAERNLRNHQRLADYEQRGVNIITVVAPLVSDTFNARYYSRVSADFVESSQRIARRYSIPETVTIEQVATRVTDLLTRHDLPQDYVESFRDLAA